MVGKTSVMEKGRGLTPKSASCRSGSSAASSASVGCSVRSAYGQNRSLGRYFRSPINDIVLQNSRPENGEPWIFRLFSHSVMSDLRSIPSIEKLRQRPSIRVLETRFGGTAVVDALRAGAADVREAMAAGNPELTTNEIAERIEAVAAAHLDREFKPSLEPVINATGVIIHTNLGRAPLSDAAVERVAAVARAYSTLEYDIGRGERGRRDVHAEALLCRLTGAEAAVVVNNNAAATMLVLAALAAGREVVVSRGELVEIGGGFRVPDVLVQSGAILREVGTTNKTRPIDYAAAISDRTALILRVHPSNFRIEGFTERPTLTDVVAVGKRFSVPIVEDLGSGRMDEDPTHPLADIEPSVAGSVSRGAD